MFTRWSDIDRAFLGLDEFRRRFDRLFDEYTTRRSWAPVPNGGWSAFDLYDNGESIIIHGDVPGMTEKDFTIGLNQHVLTITGELKADVPEGYSVHRKERATKRFSRSFGIPCDVNADKAVATVKHGVLTVMLPKAETARPKQIAVSNG